MKNMKLENGPSLMSFMFLLSKNAVTQWESLKTR
jgi:hypothetical protein